MNIRLSEYIRQAKTKGMSENKIRDELVKAGWPILEIEEAFEKTEPIKPDRPKGKAFFFWRNFIIVFLILGILGAAAFGFWYVDQKIQKPNVFFEEEKTQDLKSSGEVDEDAQEEAILESVKITEIPADYQLKQVYFSADGKSIILIALKAKQEFIFYNGQAGTGYDSITNCQFNGNASYFFCIAKKGKKETVVINNNEGSYYDSLIKNPVFSPNGEILAYLAESGANKFLVLSGQELPFNYDLAGKLVFSPNSDYLAYIAAKGSSKFLVINEQETQIEDGAFLDPFFSNDSKKISYMVKTGSEIYWKEKAIEKIE